MNSENLSYSHLATSSFCGIIRAAIGMPIEYPLDCIKTNWQANPELKSTKQVVQLIYRQHGIYGFYNGWIPSTVQRTFEQAYRFPLVIAIPKFYKKHLPKNVQSYFSGIDKGLTGITIATFETFVSPFERIKVWEATKEHRKLSFFSELKNKKSNKIFELYKGVRASYAKSLVSWTTFLLTDHWFKQFAKQYEGKKELNALSLAIVSLSVGIVCTMVVLPIDVVKTHMQMVNPSEHVGILRNITYIIKKYGFRGIIVGWPIKMTTSTLQTALTVTTLEKVQEYLWPE